MKMIVPLSTTSPLPPIECTHYYFWYFNHSSKQQCNTKAIQVIVHTKATPINSCTHKLHNHPAIPHVFIPYKTAATNPKTNPPAPTTIFFASPVEVAPTADEELVPEGFAALVLAEFVPEGVLDDATEAALGEETGEETGRLVGATAVEEDGYAAALLQKAVLLASAVA